jgi:hypothetical protein
MSDIYCVVCKEPWDAYGVNHGDMLAWEAKLFRQGAGCPCCKGERPDPLPPFEGLFDFDNGDGDPMDRVYARELAEQGNAPAWKEPEPTVLWTCGGCGVQVVRDESECWLDGTTLKGEPIQYRVPAGAKCRKWYHSHNFDRGEPTAEPAATLSGEPVCEFCLSHCDRCGANLCSHLDYGDTYDEGNAFSHESHGYDSLFCVDCYSEICSEEEEPESEPVDDDEDSDDEGDDEHDDA